MTRYVPENTRAGLVRAGMELNLPMMDFKGRICPIDGHIWFEAVLKERRKRQNWH